MVQAQPDQSPPTPVPVTATLCPLCQVAMRAKYRGIEAEETGARFAVVACPRCGLGRTDPSPDDLGPYYGPAYYGNRHGLTARWCVRRRLGIVRRHAGLGAGRVLLDYGCGDGSFLQGAQQRGWNCRGVERVRPESIPVNLPIVASLADLDPADRIDCATFWHVLEHLDNPVAVLQDLRRRMMPGALVLAAVPNLGSWQSRVTGAAWLHLDLPRHLSHFTAESLKRTFHAGGFAVEALAWGELEYDLIGWSQGVLNRSFGGRNEFFKAVSGRPSRQGTTRTRFQVAAGLGLSVLAVVPTWVEAWARRGGTLIVAARAARN